MRLYPVCNVSGERLFPRLGDCYSAETHAMRLYRIGFLQRKVPLTKGGI